MNHRCIRAIFTAPVRPRIPRSEGATDIRILTACGLAMAAILSLAACGGSGDMNSRPALALGDIRELAGLSAPIETGSEQQARQQDIYSRADSLILSTVHLEGTVDGETHSFRMMSECSGAVCTLVEPVTGVTDTTSLGDVEVVLGEAEAIGSAHGITLMSETVNGTDKDITDFGAWMQHSAFLLDTESGLVEGIDATAVNAAALGELTGRPPAGSATWLGIMVGTPVAGDHEGDRLVGTAALNYDLDAGGLDAAFSGITNVDRGVAHDVETVFFVNLAVAPDGTFARGQSGTRIQGGFYGPDHAEAAGIFEQSDIVGAFGAKRQ